MLERVVSLAAKHGAKPAQIALAWVANTPGITAPIVGATSTSQLEGAVAALNIRLDAEDRKALEQPYRPRATID